MAPAWEPRILGTHGRFVWSQLPCSTFHRVPHALPSRPGLSTEDHSSSDSDLDSRAASRKRSAFFPVMQNANVPVSESDAESVESNEDCSHGHEAGRSGLAHVAGFAAGQSGSSPRPGKKTRGRVKIKMEFINNKLRRYTTFSKRKTGIMKKAYELSTLTGTQVMLLVASETGHVYTFATRKLQPMITSESGKALIQTCLNSPDSPPRPNGGSDQRMSATGFEETELSYAMPDGETAIAEDKEVMRTALVTVRSVPGALQTPGGTISTVQLGSSPGFPLTNYMGSVLGPTIGGSNNINKSTTTTNAATIVPSSLTVMPGTLFPAGTPTVSLGSLVPQLALSSQCACSGSSTQSAAQTVFRFPASAHQILSIEANNMAQPLQTIHVPPTSMVQQVSSSTTSTSSSISSSSSSNSNTIVASNSAPFALQPPPGTLTLQATTPIPIALQPSTGQQIPLQQQQQQHQQQAVALMLQPAAAPLPTVSQSTSTTTSSTVTLLDTSQGAVSIPTTGQMMYQTAQGMMYTDGLTVLNTINNAPGSGQEPGVPISQVVLTSSGPALHIPVSAVSAVQLQQLSSLAQQASMNQAATPTARTAMQPGKTGKQNS